MVDFDVDNNVLVVEVDNCVNVDGVVVRAAHRLLPTLPTVLVARILSIR